MQEKNFHLIDPRKIMKPCPFCKSLPKEYFSVDGDLFYYMFCPKCKAKGPQAPDAQKARQKWNKRHLFAVSHKKK